MTTVLSPPSPPPPATLTEHVADWHAGRRVDTTHRMVHNVALTGGVSKNGYRYSEQALRQAVGLYDNKPVFLDHARDRSRPHERSTRDLVGTIVNPRYEAGRIRGDIRVLDTDSGRTFLALAEAEAPDVGMSHVVRARRGSADGPVEQIDEVVSVDAVVFPATTRTLRESASRADESIDVPGDPSDEERCELHTRFQQLLDERDALRSELRQLREQQQVDQDERRLQQQLAAAGLPAGAVTDLFRDQLHRADERQRAELIAERRALLDAARRQPPLSVERQRGEASCLSNATFITAIRRR
jgi:hypothetical protein